MADPTLKAQVEERIRAVRDALDKAIGELDGRWWHTAATEAALGQLRGTLTTAIDAWVQSGESAANGTTPPGAGGWSGWLASGQNYINGIAEQAEWSSHATLDNIKQTAADIDRDAGKVAAQAVATVRRAAVATGKTVGETAGAVIAPVAKPLTLPLGFIAAGLVAVAFIMGGRK